MKNDKLILNYVNDLLINVYVNTTDGNVNKIINGKTDRNKYIGDFMISDDGYFHYLPKNDIGTFNEYSLMLISKKLKELNKEWDNQIKNNLNGK